MIVDNQKIARNTLMLYIRTLVIMLISLYTSRVILSVLGIDDYGLYNLVGGFVTIFSFISNSIVSAMQRYFNIAIGIDDNKKFIDIFSTCFNIIFIISLLILVCGELLGLWLFNIHLNIPDESIKSAIWVYQLSIITFIVTLLRSPYNAAIIAYEKMSFYAYISIIEAILRLGIVFVLAKIKVDKLILYAVLYLGVSVIITYIYRFYCLRTFETCKYRYTYQRDLAKELSNFTGWTLLGQLSVLVNTQGVNILINKFFAVAVNAAMGITNQVSSALGQFVLNFQTAFNPQLIKTYAVQDIENHTKLLYRSSKFSYYLLLVLSVPVIFNIDYILRMWLVDVPPYTASLTIYCLVANMLNTISSPFGTSILATGKINKYQILQSLLFLLGLYLSYLFLRKGFPPDIVMVVNIMIQFLFLLLRVIMAKCLVDIKLLQFVKDVLLPIMLVTIISTSLPLIVDRYVSTSVAMFFSLFIYFGWTLIVIMLVGLKRQERNILVSYLKNKFESIVSK